jgi:hypothetical protein
VSYDGRLSYITVVSYTVYGLISTTIQEPNVDRGARFYLLMAHMTHMLVSSFFPVRALSPLPLHPHGPRRNPLTD